MNSLQLSLFAVAISFCVVCLCRARRFRDHLSSMSLAIFLYLATLSYLAEWLILHPGTPIKAFWLSVVMASALWMLPAFYMGMSHLLGNSKQSIPWQLWSLACVGSFALLPLAFSSHMGSNFHNPHKPASIQESFVVHSGMYFASGLFICAVPSLLMYAWRQLKQVNIDAQRVGKWLMLALFVKWFTGLLRVMECRFFGAGGGVALNVLMTLDIGLTLWILSNIFREPKPFTNNADSEPETTQTLDKQQKYRSSGLDGSTRTRIQNKLQAFSCTKQHRNSELSLQALSTQLRERPHYLSQVINQTTGGNFYQWLNALRVEDAKVLLLADNELRILDIAETVGFNSKSTFNSAFKKHTGLNPRQFKQQNPCSEGTNRTARA